MISQMGYDEFMCWKCKEPIAEGLEIFRSTQCSRCGASLHSCVNCRFYQPGSHYDCHETIDEEVRDKEAANFCDYFSVNPHPASGNSTADEAKKAARSAFDNIFSL